MSAVVLHALTGAEAHAICAILHFVEHIVVTADVDDQKVVHVRASGVLTTLEEVTALRAFAAVTDARLAWHGAVA